MGDLDHLDAYQAFQRDIALYQQLFEITPQVIVHDLHPDYASTNYAIGRGRVESINCVGVQHHHSHLASCMAEHRLDGEVIGVIFDGSGYGNDATIWGGEFLVGDYQRFRRAVHLRPIRLPGGDSATKQPWRVALSHLDDAACDADDLLPNSQSRSIAVMRQMISRGINSPWTSRTAGRLFDAVAAIAVCVTRSALKASQQSNLKAWRCGPRASYRIPTRSRRPPAVRNKAPFKLIHGC